MSDIMTVQGLDLWYGDHQALHDISMNIPEKSITALIGPSGCGKSTFLKTLNRMNDLIPGVKITGDVRYREQDIFAPGTDVNELRREIGMVFQKPNPFPMSIYDNIAYGPRTHGIKNRAKLDEIVEKSLRGAAIWDEVKDRLRKNALGLSGGQQQRLCIARALAVKPEVLLMDEPFGALDAQTRTQLQTELLETWEREKKTCFFITHDVEEAIILAQRVIIMSARPGRIKDIVDINIPYPRTQETKLTPEFNEMIGFTEEEVRQMLTYYSTTSPFNHSVDELIEIIKP